jgi:hypothetical protein
MQYNTSDYLLTIFYAISCLNEITKRVMNSLVYQYRCDIGCIGGLPTLVNLHTTCYIVLYSSILSSNLAIGLPRSREICIAVLWGNVIALVTNNLTS